MEALYVIKIGGNVLDNPEMLVGFLEAFSEIKASKILIHGGGKALTALAEKQGIEQTMIDGRRVTDAATMQLATMVYAGDINKNCVAQLQANGCNAIGLTGADGNLIQATKRPPVSGIDYGMVGDVESNSVNGNLLQNLLHLGLTPVMPAITHDGNGNLLNTNADTLASILASAMKPYFAVSLIYCFEKKGVLLNADDDDSVIGNLNLEEYNFLKEKGIIYKGMIPKLDNAFAAKSNGVAEVIIAHAMDLAIIMTKNAGTQISL